VKRIRNDMFFGYKTIEYDGFMVPVSDLEKTVIDMLYFHGGIRGELWPGILERLDRKRLREYLERYDGRFGKRVLLELKNNG
jgi:predicted transcriptional regulator of viral defense system